MSVKFSLVFTCLQFFDEHCDHHGYLEQLACGDILVFLVFVIMYHIHPFLSRTIKGGVVEQLSESGLHILPCFEG